ncbi:hypothetical protein Hanom_Chr08g00709751 [Helianthus anomalus]
MVDFSCPTTCSSSINCSNLLYLDKFQKLERMSENLLTRPSLLSDGEFDKRCRSVFLKILIKSKDRIVKLPNPLNTS